MDTVERVLSLLSEYGYWIVLFGVMLESAGVPIPGETVLVASGFLAQQGRLGIGDTILLGATGAVIGDQIGYWIGREGGRPFVLRWGRYVLITPERLSRAEHFFEHHGGKAVFLARFFAGLRVFGALVAGISKMRWRTFLLYNALGGTVWATASVLVGYLLGGSLTLIERWMGRATTLLAILLVAGLILYAIYRWIATHPEKIKRVYEEKIGGRRLNTLLRSPTGFWIRRRFSPGETYGLVLTVGLLLTGLFSWAFGGIVEDLLSSDPLMDLDVAVLQFVYSHGNPDLTAAVVAFELVFSPEALLLVGAAVGGLLAARGWRRRNFDTLFSGVVLLAASFGAAALVEFFKFFFNRPRPPVSLQLSPETGLSFPSAHALAALVVGAAALYVWSLRPAESWGSSWKSRARAGLVVFALALLVGLGRVYTGGHYPSDVLAGWALGGVWASICLTAAEVFRRLRMSKV